MLATLEDIQEQVFAALKSLGTGWHTRAAIAVKLNKRHLNPVDVAALELLASGGRVEKLTQPSVTSGRGSNLTRIVYRVKEQ